jgi:hypothetical protein
MAGFYSGAILTADFHCILSSFIPKAVSLPLDSQYFRSGTTSIISAFIVTFYIDFREYFACNLYKNVYAAGHLELFM